MTSNVAYKTTEQCIVCIIWSDGQQNTDDVYTDTATTTFFTYTSTVTATYAICVRNIQTLYFDYHYNAIIIKYYWHNVMNCTATAISTYII